MTTTGRRGLPGPVLVGTLLLVLAFSTGAAAQEHAGQYAQPDIEYGFRLYTDNCFRCHAEGGDGIAGINLSDGQFRNADSDFGLMRLIRTGIAGTAMPPGDYSQSELTALVAYLRNMRSIDPGNVTLGDADSGRTLFTGRGDCASCHRVNGDGPRVAPDLSDIGRLRTAARLQASLLDPTGSMIPINRPIRAVTRDGTVITGRRINEDTYTVQLIDDNERLRSLEKSGLREYTVLTASPMPSYAETFDEQERADVLAYLLSLKGLD